jgi:O-antigen/teichoic acid export membrane protein
MTGRRAQAITGRLDRRAVNRRIAAALGASMVGRVVAVAVQIAGPALFLGCWSVDRYGEWLLLTALPGSLAASDLGFCAAAANDMTMRAARGDIAGARAVFQHGLGLVLILGGGVALIVLALVLAADPAAALGLTKIDRDQARLILAILTVQVAVGLPGELLLGGFRAANRFAEGLMIGNLWALVDIGCIIAALIGIGTPVAVAVAALASQALRLVVTALLMTRRLGWPGLLRPRVSLAEYRRLLPPALGFASVPLARAGVNQGLVILIGLMTDSRLVVAFTTTRTAVRLISTVAGLVTNAISSELSVAWAGDHRALLRTLLFGAGQVTVWSALAAALLLLAGREPLARLWLHGAVTLDLGLMLPLMAAEMAGALGRVGFILLAAANRHAPIALTSCLLSAAGLALAALLIPLAGVVGAAIAMMVSEGVTLVITLRGATRLAETSVAAFLAQALIPPWRGLHHPS